MGRDAIFLRVALPGEVKPRYRAYAVWSSRALGRVIHKRDDGMR
jgi:hypothetical protein